MQDEQLKLISNANSCSEQSLNYEEEYSNDITYQDDSGELYTDDNKQYSNDELYYSDGGDCDIKGSVNGIFHTPGGAYYNSTRNVVESFCTTEEAVAAGYRASER